VTGYRAPVASIWAALDAAGLAEVLALPHFAQQDPEDLVAVLEGFGAFAAEVLAPSDGPGDRHGAVLDPVTGRVSVAPEVSDAFAKWVAGGWAGLGADPEHGGGGLPRTIALAAEEMFASANMALSLNPMLTQGGIHLLETVGSPEQRARYLPGLVSGRWTGTMVLTEPQAGSDLGGVTTTAVPGPDGSWSLSGQKIFITWGEHELAENIVHFVLARTPDAPRGSRGLSLFLVPKHLVEPGGDAPERNGVRCIGVEHKLGIHSSPTCTLAFDRARAELVGEVGGGMACMFLMMNAARLSVGLEGLAVTERAFQQAHAYAYERTQGRAPGASSEGMTPIVEHPDVARMLVSMRSSIDAMRMLVYSTAVATDLARHHPDADARRAAQTRVDLLTPLTKAWCTDEGTRQASVAIQVHGGMGYVEETGVAQRLRDARIAQIYEGTNGIQAIDLVSRKVRRDGGAALRSLIADLEASLADVARLDGLGLAGPLGLASDALAAVVDAAAWLVAADERDALSGATPFLEMAATAVAGALMAQLLLRARTSGSDGGRPAVAARFSRFAIERLALVPALRHAVCAGHSGLERGSLG
jgi:alkylation response protein AidB-like acyl-CoA dehydrogenase